MERQYVFVRKREGKPRRLRTRTAESAPGCSAACRNSGYILAGEIALRLSVRQLAALFGVSERYIHLARELSSGKRQAIANGLDQTSFAALLLKPPVERPALPAPKLVSDEQLAAAIRSVGIDRTLEIAASVESYAA